MGENAAFEKAPEDDQATNSDNSFSDSQRELDRAIEELNGLGESAAPSTSKIAQPLDSDTGATVSDLVWDIPVEINIVMGTARLTVARLMELENGEIVELDRRVGEPLDIAVNGRNIAKGEIVMMDDDPSKFAIQVTELVGR